MNGFTSSNINEQSSMSYQRVKLSLILFFSISFCVGYILISHILFLCPYRITSFQSLASKSDVANDGYISILRSYLCSYPNQLFLIIEYVLLTINTISYNISLLAQQKIFLIFVSPRKYRTDSHKSFIRFHPLSSNTTAFIVSYNQYKVNISQ